MPGRLPETSANEISLMLQLISPLCELCVPHADHADRRRQQGCVLFLNASKLASQLVVALTIIITWMHRRSGQRQPHRDDGSP